MKYERKRQREKGRDRTETVEEGDRRRKGEKKERLNKVRNKR